LFDPALVNEKIDILFENLRHGYLLVNYQKAA